MIFKGEKKMNKFVKIGCWLMAIPVVASLTGCPAMAVARVAKKASESSSSSDKDSTTSTGTSSTAAH